MCRPFSFVVTKKKLFWLENNDSHEDIISEYNLFHLDRKRQLVRVEFLPPKGENYPKYLSPLRKWNLLLDNFSLCSSSSSPKWYDEEKVRRDILSVIPGILKQRIVRPNQKVSFPKRKNFVAVYGRVIYAEDCKMVLYKKGKVVSSRYCDIRLCDNSHAEEILFSSVYTNDKCSLKAESSQVVLSGADRVEALRCSVFYEKGFIGSLRLEESALTTSFLHLESEERTISKVSAKGSVIHIYFPCRIETIELSQSLLIVDESFHVEKIVLKDDQSFVVGNPSITKNLPALRLGT